MRKTITYEVNASLKFDGEIQGSSCECTAGHSENAHCKHVCVTLFAIRDVYAKKPAITKQTTTQQLQTFHQPAKRYTGSPMKAKTMALRKKKNKTL